MFVNIDDMLSLVERGQLGGCVSTSTSVISSVAIAEQDILKLRAADTRIDHVCPQLDWVTVANFGCFFARSQCEKT